MNSVTAAFAVSVVIACTSLSHAQPPQQVGDGNTAGVIKPFGGTSSQLPITDELRKQGVFLNEKRVVPAGAEWNREIIAKHDGNFRIAIVSDAPKGVVVVTSKAHKAILAKQMDSIDRSDIVLVADTTEKLLRRTVKLAKGSYVLMLENRASKPTETYLRCYAASKPVVLGKEYLASTVACEFGELSFRLPKEYQQVQVPRATAMPAEIEMAVWREMGVDETPKAVTIAMSFPDSDTNDTMRQKLVDSIGGTADRMKISLRTDNTLTTLGESPLMVQRLDFSEQGTDGTGAGGAIFGIVHEGRLYTFSTFVYQGSVEEVRGKLSLCMAQIARK